VLYGGGVAVSEGRNLRLDARPDHLFRGLHDVRISGGPRPIGLTYHHIVPYSKLRDFWNRLVESGDIGHLNFLALLRDKIANKKYADIPHPLGRLVDNDARDVVTLASDIYRRRFVHDAGGSRPTGWDNLMGIYCWIPGNLFLGPQDRCDDPEDELDEAAFKIIGIDRKRRCDNLSDAYNGIMKYLGGQSTAAPASKALGKVVASPTFQAFNDADWIWFDGKTGPQVRGKQ
jgi:hypothetical protein